MAPITRSQLKQLAAAIVTLIRAEGGAPTKTKLLKLLYLADVENWRDNRDSLTGLNWIFYLYGPWTDEYDPLLNEMVQDRLVDIRKGNEDGEATFVNPVQPGDLGKVGLATPTYFAMKDLIGRWGPQRTADLLDYVYFETEPMLNAVRGERLDFGSVRRRADVPLYRPVRSNARPGELERARRTFQASIKESHKLVGDFRSPRYDEAFSSAVESLNLEDE